MNQTKHLKQNKMKLLYKIDTKHDGTVAIATSKKQAFNIVSIIVKETFEGRTPIMSELVTANTTEGWDKKITPFTLTHFTRAGAATLEIGTFYEDVVKIEAFIPNHF